MADSSYVVCDETSDTEDEAVDEVSVSANCAVVVSPPDSLTIIYDCIRII